MMHKQGYPTLWFKDNDYMLEVHLWDGLDMQPGHAHVCMKASR